MLFLAAVGLLASVYALIEGRLWSAGICAFSAVLLLITYRGGKRLNRQP